MSNEGAGVRTPAFFRLAERCPRSSLFTHHLYVGGRKAFAIARYNRPRPTVEPKWRGENAEIIALDTCD